MMLKEDTLAQLVIFMGVSGCGKSTIGKHWASTNDYSFFDADNFHSDEAKSLMQQGLPLSDEIRLPWIRRMVTAMENSLQTNHCVLAYSGLKSAHRREFLRIDAKVTFVHLVLSESVAMQRVSQRSEHFFPSDLVKSQFEALETPEQDEPIVGVSAEQDVELILNEVSRHIARLRS